MKTIEQRLDKLGVEWEPVPKESRAVLHARLANMMVKSG